jgi:hypothetical protein
MQNNKNLKWHQKSSGVIFMLIVFWPVGIGLMWKNKIWSEKIRTIITGLFLVALAVSLIVRNLPATSSKQQVPTSAAKQQQQNIESSIPASITYAQAEAFMRKRCREVRQTLMRSKTVYFKGTKLYMFLTVAKNGYVCISSISENALEVLASDCGSSEIKIEQWNALN